MNKFDINRILKIIGAIALLVALVFTVWWFKGEDIAIINPPPKKILSSISGLECTSATQRPFAVMLSSDPETRPLSGVGQADMVFEMPVTPNGVTRMMAVYQCELPNEIGSIRSSRADFIPLAGGMKAIYAHWGGEHDALESLNKGVLNNVDALKYEGIYYSRKNSIPRPHNGFTSITKLIEAANKLKYSLVDSLTPYPHTEDKPSRNISNIAEIININYPGYFRVTWKYDAVSNTYRRTRGATAEIDRNTNKQVEVAVVINMKTTSNLLRDQYINVRTTGTGEAVIYQNGVLSNVTWKKDPTTLDSKLIFLENGKEFKFRPGKIWVNITTD
jgi:hypothetical protein